MKKICLALLVLVLVVSSAQSAPVIILPTDGAAGNTVRTSDGGTDWLGGSDTTTTWRDRATWAGFAPDLPVAAYKQHDSVELCTTIEGLEAFEDVDVWVLFSSSWKVDGSVNKNNWIDAGATSGALTAYSVGAGNAIRTGLISRPSSMEGDKLYYEVCAGYMGTLQADEDGIITLYADYRVASPIDGVSSGDRTVFHGYSLYEAPVPEPATMALLGFGGLALLRKRK